MRNITYANGLYTDHYRINLHTHPCYELVYVTHGNGKVRIDKNVESFCPGTFTIVAPNVPHTEYGEKGFQNLNLSIENPGIPISTYVCMQDSENKDVLRIVQQIVYEFHYRRNNWQKIVDGLYEVLTYILIDFSHGAILNPFVQQIINCIIDNISNAGFTINEAMKNIPFHPNHIRRLFFTETGMTPQQFLINKRMKYATELLERMPANGMDIQGIALTCGYEDRNYFSRAFKLHTGLSPRHWYNERLVSGKNEDEPIPEVCETYFCDEKEKKE